MPIDLSVIGKPLPPTTHQYSEKDVMLYALGIGAGGEADELDFVYERNLKVLPTFGVIPAFSSQLAMGSPVTVNPAMVLHGEQRIELNGPIPTQGTVTTTPTIRAIYDKIKGAVIVVDAVTTDDKGRVLFKNTFTTFVRGEGGFGGDRGPTGAKNVLPSRPADAVVRAKTLPQQALIYRLSGDMNPLHADPQFAQLGGYQQPILHGLCSFGYAGRAVLRTYCGNDPTRFKSLDARFSGVVFPGETIVTEMWLEEGDRVILQARTEERGDVVISNGAATVAA